MSGADYSGSATHQLAQHMQGGYRQNSTMDPAKMTGPGANPTRLTNWRGDCVWGEIGYEPTEAELFDAVRYLQLRHQ